MMECTNCGAKWNAPQHAAEYQVECPFCKTRLLQVDRFIIASDRIEEYRQLLVANGRTEEYIAEELLNLVGIGNDRKFLDVYRLSLERLQDPNEKKPINISEMEQKLANADEMGRNELVSSLIANLKAFEAVWLLKHKMAAETMRFAHSEEQLEKYAEELRRIRGFKSTERIISEFKKQKSKEFEASRLQDYEQQQRIDAERAKKNQMVEQSKIWVQQGRCSFCGGRMKGIVSKKCVDCGNAGWVIEWN